MKNQEIHKLLLKLAEAEKYDFEHASDADIPNRFDPKRVDFEDNQLLIDDLRFELKELGYSI